MILSSIILIILSACQLTFQTPSPFSLQPAVDALSDRELQLALRDEMENGNIGDFAGNDEFEWNNDYDLERGQHMPNKAMARYLARSNSDYDENFLGYKKRAMFRKRDPSVFRERSRSPSYRQQQAELSERFLKAIEEEREKERVDEYREQLKDLWNRYQMEENDIERELFKDGNDIETDELANYEDQSRKKKRQRGEAEIAPSNWSDKRSMPLLPWLPAQRKKRFPVTKRSPKMNENDMLKAVSETSDKVSKDLQGIFGNTNDNKAKVDDDKKKKRKRSSDDMIQIHSDRSHGPNQEREQPSLASAHNNDDRKKKRIVKRNNDESGEEEDYGDVDEEEQEQESEESDDDDDAKKKKKKKREAKKSLEPETQYFLDKKSPKKKSVQWSSIFGYDRKKKSMIYNPFRYSDQVDQRRKKDDSDDEDDYIEPDADYEYTDETKKKRMPGEDRLNAMDRKLKTIENLIIEDTAKMYRHQNENASPSEAKDAQKQLSERLATAYSLEKMRKAIAKLKASMAFQKGLEQNLLSIDDENDEEDKKKKAKRVAVKKEKADFDNNDHEIELPLKKVKDEDKNNIDEDNDDKKKKKRSQKRNNEINELPLMSESYMGNMMFQRECSILDSVERRCREVGILSGDSHQNLLETCGEHQLCYLCGDSRGQCDYKYQNDVNEVCGYNSKCRLSAERALDALRSFPGIKIGPRECIRNPCLYSALRSIDY